MADKIFFQPNDAYTLMNDIAKQATGRKDLVPVDTTSFVSVGETVLRYGYENTLNAISTVIGRTIFSARPYKSPLRSLYVSEQRWGEITRKITPLSLEAEASQDMNTNLNPAQLADGQSIDMYKIRAPKAVELHFSGSNVLQRHITRFIRQLNTAFRNEGEFLQFISTIMTEYYNDIETDNENKTRLTLISFMAGLYVMDLNVRDLTAEFNALKGTSYTRDQILNQHLTEFMQFFVVQIGNASSFMKNRSALYHANLDGYQDILRHTPVSKQRMYMYGPLFRMAEASVFSEIFNPIYLQLGQNFEQVDFWQAEKTRTAINVTPKILDTTTGETKDGNVVSIPYVVGVLFDEEACGVMPKFSMATSTPLNSAGLYYNMFMHWEFRSFIDFTENAMLFVMGDGGTPTRSK